MSFILDQKSIFFITLPPFVLINTKKVFPSSISSTFDMRLFYPHKPTLNFRRQYLYRFVEMEACYIFAR